MPKARLTVLRTGVTGIREISDGLPDSVLAHFRFRQKSRKLAVGESVEGRVYLLHSLPRYGGRIVLARSFRNDFIDGLVDPSNGKPRVVLDIFDRSR